MKIRLPDSFLRMCHGGCGQFATWVDENEVPFCDHCKRVSDAFTGENRDKQWRELPNRKV